MFTGKEKNRDYFRDKIFVGLVEDVRDVRRKGRIRVRVQGVFDKIPTEHIPWASPSRNTDGKYFNVPAIGKIVNVMFVDGNIYEPQYIYSENYNINLQNKINGLSADEYSNFFASLFDHRTQIYSDDQKLMMDFYHNNINIKQDSINLNLKDNNQKLNLGNNAAGQSAVLGDHFMEWFDEFISTLLNPSSLTGNLGAAILKPQLDTVMTKYQALRQTFLSKHVKIVDNSSCADNDPDRESAPTKDDFTKFNNKTIIEESPVKEKIIENRVNEDLKSQVNEPVKVEILEENDGLDGPPDEERQLPSTGTTIEVVSEVTMTTFIDESGNTTVEESTRYVLDESVTIGAEEDLENKTYTSQDMEDLGLSDSQKQALSKQNTDKAVQQSGANLPVVVPSDTSDPYGNFWAGRKGKTTDELNNTSPVYGAYTYEYTGKIYKDGEYINPSYAPSTSNCGSFDTTIFDDSDPTIDEPRMKVPPTIQGCKNGYLDTAKLKRIPDEHVYKPPRLLEAEACDQLLAMIEAAKADGVKIIISSAYRTYEQQIVTSKKPGGAPAGGSPHGLGCAVDINGIQSLQKEWMIANNAPSYVLKAAGDYAREKSDLYKWLDKNGRKFGWYNPWRLKRSPKCNEAWHFEYWGYWKNSTGPLPKSSSNNCEPGYSIADDGTWGNPTIGNIITNFTPITSENETPHNGVDISGIFGNDIWSVYSGKVIFVGFEETGAGNYTWIEHNVNGQKYVSVYMHQSKILVKLNDSVTKGQVIGNMGNTGLSTESSHLHFEIRQNTAMGEALDPQKLVSGLGTLRPSFGACDDGSGGSVSVVTSKDKEDNIKNIVLALKADGITNLYWIAGILACVYKETGFVPKAEYSYKNTSAKRIREIFGNDRKGLHSKSLGDMTDAEIDSLTQDNVKFYDLIYGGQNGNNKHGDGYKYRGRGYNGLTFKSSYESTAKSIGVDIVSNPDSVNNSNIAAKTLAHFFSIKNNPVKKALKSTGLKSLADVKDINTGVKLAVVANAGGGKPLEKLGKTNQDAYKKAKQVAPDLYEKTKKYYGSVPSATDANTPITTSCGTMGAGDTAALNSSNKSGTSTTGTATTGTTSTGTATNEIKWEVGTNIKNWQIGDLINTNTNISVDYDSEYVIIDWEKVNVPNFQVDIDLSGTESYNKNDIVGTYIKDAPKVDKYPAGTYVWLKKYNSRDENLFVLFPKMNAMKKIS